MEEISFIHSNSASQSPSSEKTFRVVDQGAVWGGPDFEFQFLAVVLTDGETYFYHEHPARKLPEDMSGIYAEAQAIPKHYYQAIPPPELTPSPYPPPDDSYIKTYSLIGFNPRKIEQTSNADLMIREAQIYERLLLNPHPNICEYRGYVHEDGWMTGLCLKIYSKTLRQAINDGDTIDLKTVIDDITSGLEHLHSIGLVHIRGLSGFIVSALMFDTHYQNDINPRNIMLKSDSVPVIIDFDSCDELGSHMTGKGGTFEWTNDAKYSEKENDFYGLRKITAWLSETISTKAI